MIIIKNKRILLLERDRYGYHYWAIPGGTLEKGESAEKTACREILEETGLKIKINKEKKPIIIDGTRHEAYFWASDAKGRPVLGGPEKERDTKGNHYALKWIALPELKKINLLPTQLKSKLLKKLS